MQAPIQDKEVTGMYDLYSKVQLKDGRKGYIIEKFEDGGYMIELPHFEIIDVKETEILKQISPTE